jgi:ABC-type sugar transport system substrate-binding protein
MRHIYPVSIPKVLRHGAAATALITVAILLVAGCGGSSGNGGGASGSGSGSKSAAGLAAARAVVKKALVRPTSLPLAPPITRPVPRGKTIDFIPCGESSTCTEAPPIAAAAAKLLGWNVETISSDGTPGSQQADLRQVVAQKPYAVIMVGVNPPTLAPFLPKLKSEGIFVVTGTTTSSIGDGVGFVWNTPTQQAPIFRTQAAEVVASSNGTADSVFVNLPAFAILAGSYKVYSSAMRSFCPTCTSNVLNLATTSIGPAATTLVVTYLRAHPKVKYVVFCADGLAPGLPAALKAADLGGISIGSAGATPQTIEDIATGTQQFSMAFPYYEFMYASIDAIARHATGMAIPTPTYPIWLLTKANAPSSGNFGSVIPGIQAKYAALWGVK